MKKTKVSTPSELMIDTVEYLFVEWLCRRGVFFAFISNCGFDMEHKDSCRAMLRYRIRETLRSSCSGVGDLISMSFLFTRTHEGYAFWSDLSFAWRRFCTDFQNNFK